MIQILKNMQGLLVLVTECYNKKWHQREGLPLKWIKNAGHNSNTDQPDEVNRLIEKFISEVDRRGVPR